MSGLELMGPALATCLVLAGIHCYLGLHIVARGVFFVDLSLAQMAALGALVGTLAGVEPESPVSYVFSAAATLVGAGLFVAARRFEGRVSSEAIIGMVYAVAAAGAILLADRSPGGAEHLKELMVGNILLTRWRTLGAAAAVFAAVGAVHVLFRGPLLVCSFRPDLAAARGFRRGLWDFVLFVSVGVVVTVAVRIAGVLVVFTLLVIPSVIAAALAKGTGARLAIGWTIGMAVSSAGVLVSYLADLSTGACVVVTFGAFALLAGIVAAIRLRDRRSPVAAPQAEG